MNADDKKVIEQIKALFEEQQRRYEMKFEEDQWLISMQSTVSTMNGSDSDSQPYKVEITCKNGIIRFYARYLPLNVVNRLPHLLQMMAARHVEIDFSHYSVDEANNYTFIQAANQVLADGTIDELLFTTTLWCIHRLMMYRRTDLGHALDDIPSDDDM